MPTNALPAAALADEKAHEASTTEKGTSAHKKDDSTPLQSPDVAPDGGYGWVVVTCAALINAHTWGINSSYGVFLAYYLGNEVFPGATYLEYAFIGGLSVSCAMLVSPAATLSTKAFGTRTTLLTGVFLETLALITASFTKEIWQLFLSQGVCFGLGMGFLFVGSVGIPAQWFSKKRSFANAIAASGSGLGGLVYSLATNAMIQRISYPWALRILGIISGVVCLTCSLLLRDRNKQVGSVQVPFDLKLFRRPEFFMVQLWGFFSMLGYIVLVFSLPNYATSIGLTQQQGSIIGALFNLGQFLGRPPIGFFSDRTGRLNMAGLATLLEGVFCLVIWVNAHSYGVLIFFAIVGGMLAGVFWATIAPVAAEVVGLQNCPAALSMTWLFIVLPTTFSEPIALELSTRTPQKYLSAQLFSGFMYIAAFLCLWYVRVWKVGDVERVQQEKEDETDSIHADARSTAAWSLKEIVALKRV